MTSEVTRDLYRDRYEPLALAGRGGQGEVWMAHDRLHDRAVALKIRRAGSDRDALLREARTLLDMRPHPALPLVRDDFFVGDRYVMVVDWVEGSSFAVPRREDAESVIGDLATVAAALDHLHSHRPPIVHRDVKPNNIIRTPDGGVVLVDFGLAGRRSMDGDTGTPVFAAPEMGRGEVGPAADVFSLAATAFVLLTGELPEAGRAVNLSAFPESSHQRVRDAFAAALSIDPAMRPATATAFIDALRSPRAPNNLPASVSSFVGRRADLVELRSLLGSTRSLTLVGPGGAGKTRLALRLADDALFTYADGVWFVELAGASSPDLVPSRVAVALGVPTQSGRPLLDAIADHLREGRQLLVLDNCEHVIDAAAALADELMRSCPDLTIVATSREALRIPGEAVWTIEPLESADSVTLFTHRAPVRSRVDPGDERISEICGRLDGVPLAIELAAAQLSSMDLDALRASLDEALGVLTGGARTNPRQETMRAAIAWSYERLDGDAQTALREMSVFAGGFTREAAAAVTRSHEQLDRLVDTSLVSRRGERFLMLETVRQFALAELDAEGRTAELLRSHADWVRSFVERTEVDGTTMQGWLARLGADVDNIEAALGHAVTEAPEQAGEIVRAAVLYWARRGPWVQGRAWVDRVLSLDALRPETRAELLRRSGDMARLQGDLEGARAALTEALALSREQDDAPSVAAALTSLGLVEHNRGDLDAATALQEECIELSRHIHDEGNLALALNNLAVVRYDRADVTGAVELLEQVIEIKRRSDDREALAIALLNVGSSKHRLGDRRAARETLDEGLAMCTQLNHQYGRSVALYELAMLDVGDGDLSLARERATESLELGRRMNYKPGQTMALAVLGAVARAEGDLDAARALRGEALDIQRQMGAPLGIAQALDLLAAIESDAGDHETAARLFGEASGLRERAGVPTDPDPDAASALETTRRALGDAYAQHHERGLIASRP